MQRNSGNTRQPARTSQARQTNPGRRNAALPTARRQTRPAKNQATPSSNNQQPLLLNGAPTSLANLAQLGGITFMPVHGAPPPGTSSPPKTSVTSLPKHVATDLTLGPANLNLKLPRPSKPPVVKLSKLSSSQSYSLASIKDSPWQAALAGTSSLADLHPPASQLPFPTTTLHQHLTKSSAGQPVRQVKKPPSNLTHTLSHHPRGPKSSTSSGQRHNNPVSSSSSSSSAFMLSDTSKLQQRLTVGNQLHLFNHLSQTVNDPLATDFLILDDIYKTSTSSQSNLTTSRDNFNSTAHETSDSHRLNNNTGSSDDDVNNISLMKLMAILNNPALTITAVSNDNIKSNDPHLISSYPQQPNQIPHSPQNMDFPHHTDSSPSRLIHNDSNQQTKLSPNSIQQVKSAPTQQASKAANLTQQHPSRPSTRLPQSASNLQNLHATPTTFSGLFDLTSNDVSQLLSADAIPKSFGQQSCNQRNMSDGGSTAASQVTRGLNKMSHLFQNNLDKCNLDSQTNNYVWSSNGRGSRISDPTLMSTSVRNLMLQELPLSSTKQPTVSVQLLRHIASQNQLNHNWETPPAEISGCENEEEKSILEPECILSIARNVPQFDVDAKRIERAVWVTGSQEPKYNKRNRDAISTSKSRLYIPKNNVTVQGKSPKNGLESMEPIQVEEVDERLVHVSEQLHILESMMNHEERNNCMPEPDEIFVNRSKRIMSRIDTMLERKKKRRFERISGREPPKTNSIEDQCAESEDEWSLDEQESDLPNLVIKTQLPLEEPISQEKREHMLSIGLVSRREKNKIVVEQCTQRSKVFTPLSQEFKPSPDAIRFVDIMLKTGGHDVQLRTETNIKRNDLPLIEGLNRNTSRIKMTFMNALGLEKRSKRTTLYKVKSGLDSSSDDAIKSKTADLNKNMTAEKSKALDQEVTKNLMLIHSRPVSETKVVLPSLATYCRDIIEPPSKNEYMKSLGLMAS